jgi:predicted secreted protein/outer membrane lipoprotein-sorting protein
MIALSKARSSGHRTGTGLPQITSVIAAVSRSPRMGDYRQQLFPGFVILVILGSILIAGCTTAPAPGPLLPAGNLTAGEIGDAFLANAGTIRDYRAEYSITTGLAEAQPPAGVAQPTTCPVCPVQTISPSSSIIRFEMKKPSLYRVEIVASPLGSPGSFGISDGSSFSWYDAATRTYGTRSGMSLFGGYDYQEIVRNVVSDRNFTVLDRDSRSGTPRYLIEVITEPWSDRYTPFVSSRIRAWIEPSTGLAWNISTYYPDAVPNNAISYDSIRVNVGIPESDFIFTPPEGSGPQCVPKYVNYVEPPRTDPSVPIDQPLPGGARYSVNESDSGSAIMLQKGDALEITLRTIPGLGFRWIMPVDGTGLVLENAGSIWELPADVNETAYFMAGTGYYRWRYRAVTTGTEVFDGVFALSGCEIQGARRFTLTVTVME